MTRYLRTLVLFWQTTLAAEMEYRTNFVLAFVGSSMMFAVSLFTLFVFYRTGYEMGGWTFPQAMLVVGLFTLLSGVQQTFLQPNRTRITELVRQGTLDFVLLKPIDSQFWISTRALSVWGAPDMVLGLILVVYAGSFMAEGPHLGPTAYLLGVVPMLIGVVILYSLGYILSTFTIWFVKLFNITIAMDALLEAGRYPIPAYPTVYQFIFTFVIPVAFMTTTPAQVMLGREHAWLWLAVGGAMAATLFVISRLFWRFALRYYTSASS